MENHLQSLKSYKTHPHKFEALPELLANLLTLEFYKFSERVKFHKINSLLLELILKEPENSFLLPAVVDFIAQVKEKKILKEVYDLSQFEFWLNTYAELPAEKNYSVRAKIVGKKLPRDDYQAFFPIGMGKSFNGSHYIAAHLSPDVDTMIASFWGWMDAFGARVGTARHLWSLPGGPPESPVTQLFRDSFGKGVFEHVARTAGNLSLVAFDLVTRHNVITKTGESLISDQDLNVTEKAILLVDQEGQYIGDWHHKDGELVRKVILRFKSCLRWFENNLHIQLISLFAKPDLKTQDFPKFLSELFDAPIASCEPAQEFTERQKQGLDDFLTKVLNVEQGLLASFKQLNQALAKLSVYDLVQVEEEINALKSSEFFDAQGKITENRPAIFNRLVKIINQLDHAIQRVRDYVERLDVAIMIKNKVFAIPNLVITPHYDIDDIKIKIDQREYITVVVQDGNERYFPIGVIWAHTLNQSTLGTVTFRDFCNLDEVRLAPYLAPISVVDHHKMALKTSSPPLALIGDVQSCNVLIAEQAFMLNDRYSMNGMSVAMIENEISELKKASNSPGNMRLLRRLLQRREAAEVNHHYYVNPIREFTEYFFFLHAILDDTDLLTKVCKRDIECVVSLLNRMHSLIAQREVEVVNLDNIPQDSSFAKEAAKRVLRNADMYAFYRQIYESKEREIEEALMMTLQNKFDPLFADTKEQNGCCRVGQTKLFSINFPSFKKIAPKMMEYWLKNAIDTQSKKPAVDLHLHMVSTIASAEEVYKNKVGHYSHQDQIWFWVPSTTSGYHHLTNFLTAFFSAIRFGADTRIRFLKSVPEEVRHIFRENVPGVVCEMDEQGIDLPIVVLHFAAGTINSRKAMITPYLPKI